MSQQRRQDLLQPLSPLQNLQRKYRLLQKDRQARGSVWGGNGKESYSTESSVLYLPLPAEVLEIILHMSSVSVLIYEVAVLLPWLQEDFITAFIL